MEAKKIKRFVQTRINANKKKRVKRPVRRYSDEEMFQAIRRVGNNQRISENDYTRKRADTDPTTANFYLRFGSFKVIAEMLFGKPPVNPSLDLKDVDEEYIVRVINEFGITTKEEYKARTISDPEVFPTEYKVIKLFKNYGNLFAAANKWCIDQQLMLCLNVRLKLGKAPNWDDYAKEGVNTKLLQRKYTLLSNLNRFVRLLEDAYEASRRNQGQTGTDDEKAIKRETEKAFKPFAKQLLS